MDFTRYLLPHLPKLASIELGYNQLDHLSDEPAGQKSLTTDTKLATVNFDGNSLNNWSEICLSLTRYPTCVDLSRSVAHPNLTDREYPREAAWIIWS